MSEPNSGYAGENTSPTPPEASPDRVQPTKGGSPLPRRGRIRTALALIAVVLAVVFVANHHTCGDRVGQQRGSSQRAGARARAGKSSLLSCSPAQPFAAKAYPPETLAVMLRQQPLRFTTPRDTIVFGSNRVTLHFSIDTSLQRLGTYLLAQYHPKYGAIVALDPNTGRIFMLVSFTDAGERNLGNELYCRDIFPSASIFKTVTASAAMEKARLSPGSTLRLVGQNHTLYHSQLRETLRGARDVPLSEAFALSINPVFGRLGVYVVGAADLHAYAVKFGFTQRIPFELAVDSGEICPAESTYQVAELASGYNQCTRMSPVLGALIGGVAATGGAMERPSVVDSVTDAATGAVLYRAQPSLWRTVITPQTATDLRSLMAEVARRGTARRAFALVKRSSIFKGWEYGGKTGNITRDSLGRVDWFCGFSRNTERPQECIAVGAVTVHGAYWTVHSSKLGAEIFARFVANLARSRKLKNEIASSEQPDTGTVEDTTEQE